MATRIREGRLCWVAVLTLAYSAMTNRIERRARGLGCRWRCRTPQFRNLVPSARNRFAKEDFCLVCFVLHAKHSLISSSIASRGSYFSNLGSRRRARRAYRCRAPPGEDALRHSTVVRSMTTYPGELPIRFIIVSSSSDRAALRPSSPAVHFYSVIYMRQIHCIL